MTVALVLATATARDRCSGGRAATRPQMVRPASPGPPLRGARTATGPSRISAKLVVTRRSRNAVPAPVKGTEQASRPPPTAQLAAGLPLPSLVGGQVTTQPLLTRLCSQLSALGLRDIVLIAPAGRGDLLAAMAWEGLSLWPGPGPGSRGAGSIEVIECASIGAELRAVAAVTRRVSGSGAPESSSARVIWSRTPRPWPACSAATANAALTAARVRRTWRRDPTCGPRSG